MAISNCLFSPTSENPCGFSVWCVLAKLTDKPRNYSQPIPLWLISYMKNLFTLLILFYSLISFSQDCSCGQYGYGSSEGDFPEFIYYFSDSTKIGFCGSIERKDPDSSFSISELNVFTCDSSKNIVGYSAISSCSLQFSNLAAYLAQIHITARLSA